MVDFLLKKNFYVNVIDNLSGGRIDNLKRHFKNKKFKFENKNICKLDKNHRFFKSCDFVFHFAGIGDIVPSIENPIRYFENNVIGTSKVLEASKKASVKKFVYAASSSCCGIAKTPTSETHKINPLYPYAMSKYLGKNFVFIGINFINFQLIQLEYLMLMDQELKQQVFMELFLVFSSNKNWKINL